MRKKKRTLTKPVILIFLLILTAFGLLGFLRFRIFQMESVLSNINRGIKRSTAEELELKQNVSGLTSSLNIYDYCKEKLGMGSARHVERIQIPSSYASNIPSAPEKEWHSKILSALGLSLY